MEFATALNHKEGSDLRTKNPIEPIYLEEYDEDENLLMAIKKADLQDRRLQTYYSGNK